MTSPSQPTPPGGLGRQWARFFFREHAFGPSVILDAGTDTERRVPIADLSAGGVAIISDRRRQPGEQLTAVLCMPTGYT